MKGNETKFKNSRNSFVSEKTIIHYSISKCPLGWLGLAATENGICFLQLDDKKDSLLKNLKLSFKNRLFAEAKNDKMFQRWENAINRYLCGNAQLRKLPLEISGTAFQRQVWDHLQKIPFGTLKSYSEVAKAIGKPKAVRAVASACANNNVSLLIPCHRVVRSDGSLAGYRWGIERKKNLLALENCL
ncbi:MAG: methylated-DNA--[protein]-cysteine S-methyltransferase [Proteobacteria bacterium]|nr:methylated-DNA--[protein]-cysteine S-methyltransferase [Pseudomonadota bacterium]